MVRSRPRAFVLNRFAGDPGRSRPSRKGRLGELVGGEEDGVSWYLSREGGERPPGESSRAVPAVDVGDGFSWSHVLAVLDAALDEVGGGDDDAEEESAERAGGGRLEQLGGERPGVARRARPRAADVEPLTRLAVGAVVDASLEGVAHERRAQALEEAERAGGAARDGARGGERAQRGRAARTRLLGDFDGVERVRAHHVRHAGGHPARHIQHPRRGRSRRGRGTHARRLVASGEVAWGVKTWIHAKRRMRRGGVRARARDTDVPRRGPPSSRSNDPRGRGEPRAEKANRIPREICADEFRDTNRDARLPSRRARTIVTRRRADRTHGIQETQRTTFDVPTSSAKFRARTRPPSRTPHLDGKPTRCRLNRPRTRRRWR